MTTQTTQTTQTKQFAATIVVLDAEFWGYGDYVADAVLEAERALERGWRTEYYDATPRYYTWDGGRKTQWEKNQWDRIRKYGETGRW